MKNRHAAIAIMLLTASCALPGIAGEPADADLRDSAREALIRAATFYHGTVASHGGYVYYYSLDLAQRWGEGEANADTIYVQPPGTPTVGDAFLSAYHATGDPYYLIAARDAGLALVEGQLKSGGWSQVIHFASAPRMGNYRHRKGGRMNNSSLDDDQTQSALRFLMRLDAALEFNDNVIHEAVAYCLESLLAAQFANGAFPQIWTGPATTHPVVAANYPSHNWRTEGRVKNYWDHYTLNDGLAGTVAATLMLAHQTYDEDRNVAALRRLGDFLILAQMPAPQPAWCQQYNFEMEPIWARKFEPAAIVGSESQDVMRTLITIADYTGDDKYLQPIPAAIDYLKNKCILPNGKLARYYELETNSPLYMDRDYNLSYNAESAPGHYGWQQESQLDNLSAAMHRIDQGEPAWSNDSRNVKADEVRKIIAALDSDGRWISTFAGERLVGQPKFAIGFRFISSRVFAENMTALSASLLAEGRRGN